MKSQIMEKEKQILTQYVLHAGDGQILRSSIPSLSKGLRSPAKTTATEDDTSVFFNHCISTVRLCKTQNIRFFCSPPFSSFFFCWISALEGQKCCHIAYSNQFKQYQIFPKEQKRINQHVKNSLLLPLAQLTQASTNLQLPPVREDVNEVSLKKQQF